ncbi:NEDD4-binding protein 1 [Lepisosteus oculatus]|uniref:NEDD4-binding protein 1 n=1 Tax=Lepisosteus oculatus TaxID=7918 RepID=UPI0037183B3D
MAMFLLSRGPGLQDADRNAGVTQGGSRGDGRHPARGEGMEEEEEEEEEEVLDEFTVPAVVRATLTSLRPTLLRVFGVSLCFDEVGGPAELAGGSACSDTQMWLQLQGQRRGVGSAKVFIKGVVSVEDQQEVTYPQGLHCVFVGARGLFLDCLIRNTSAYVVVGSPGCLLVSGLMEPVMQAYTLVLDLVDKYQGTQSQAPDPRGAAAGDPQDVRRAFRALVEAHEDRHSMDLLLLPGPAKEVLLELLGGSCRSAGPAGGAGGARPGLEGAPPSGPGPGWDGRGGIPGARVAEESTDPSLGEEEEEAPGAGEEGALLSSGSQEEFGLLLTFFTAMGYGEGVVQRVLARTGPREASQILDLVQQEQDGDPPPEELGGGGEAGDFVMGILRSAAASCGYAEEDVLRACSAMPGSGGGLSAGQLLLQLQAEAEAQGGAGREAGPGEGGGERREWAGLGDAGSEVGKWAGLGVGGERRTGAGLGEERGQRAGLEEVGGGERREWAGLGDAGSEVGKWAGLEVGGERRMGAGLGEAGEERGQRAGLEEVGGGEKREWAGLNNVGGEMGKWAGLGVGGERRAGAGLGEERGQWAGLGELGEERGQRARLGELGEERGRERDRRRGVDPEGFGSTSRGRPGFDAGQPEWGGGGGGGGREYPPDIPDRRDCPRPERSASQAPEPPRGTPIPPGVSPPDSGLRTGGSGLRGDARSPRRRASRSAAPAVKGPPRRTYPKSLQDLSPAQSPDPLLPAPLPPETQAAPAGRGRRRGGAMKTAVTGPQRYQEVLQTPFDLRLTDAPGNPNLRQIIIDGSNVAMSHGLGHFFSCRGIALAVQYFWNRGHRKITTFVPQWRLKKDPKVKEQHYLTELQNLGLLSLTPSREIMGKRISSYDDRFMLQLAQQTDGVVVTNDNLRDLVDESPAFRNIIKKRLLQYTFAGDHFMVPDDPLGRGGPHLDVFLSFEHRPPVTGSHTFAGPLAATGASSSHSPPPRSQSEVLQYRDRAPGGASAAAAQARERPPGAAGEPGRDRSAAETDRLRLRLLEVFPEQDSAVQLALNFNPTLRDVNDLSYVILGLQAGE